MGFGFAGKWRWTPLIPLLVALYAADVRAIAVEPAAEFVKGLEARGLNELALEYLERMKTSPLANDDLRRQIPYLRGEALIEQSRQATDPESRTRLLDEARQELERFAEANAGSVESADAQLQLAIVQLTRGQELVAQADQVSKEAAFAAQRKSLGHDARVMFAEARDTFGRAETIYSHELEKLPPTASAEAQTGTGSKRQELRSRLVQVRLLSAQSRFEESRSYPPAADEFRKLNQAAAQDLATIYDEYGRSMLLGLVAGLYEGRCYQALGENQKALGCFEEIISKDNVLPPFRKLTASAIQRKAEVLVSEKKYDAAIEACRNCVKDAHREEVTQPEWLGVRFQLARALLKKGESLPADSVEHRRLVGEARDAYRMVAKSPSEFQLAARTAAAAAGSEKKAGEAGKEEPKSFQQAYDLGKEALSSFSSAKQAIPTAEKNNPPAVPELQQQMNEGKEDARRLFRQALTLVEADTDPKQLNEVRYYLCWLYWENGDYYRSAVLGEFIAERFPTHPSAGSAAKIAMASFEQLYAKAASAKNGGDSGDFEGRHMVQMAELIAKRSPGTADADRAFSVLCSYAIRSGRLDQADKLLGEVSAQTRPQLEMQLGGAAWMRYLERNRPSQTPPPDEAELTKLKNAASKYLKSGFESLRKEKDAPSSDLGVATGLFFAQALLNDDKYQEAIAVLEDEKAGPLTLIAHDNPTAAKPQFAIETYKAAMRAYVSISPPQDDKAIAAMHSLEKVMKAQGNDEKTAEQLTLIYLSIGAALQKQIEDLHAAGKEAEAKRVGTAFAKFVDKMWSQQGANWTTRSWLAQSYLTMAADRKAAASPRGDKETPAPLDNVTRVYYTKARDAFLQLIKDATADPKLAPSPVAILQIKLRLAECYRALGQFDKAIDAYSAVLKEKEASLDVQRAAAMTYAERGQREDAKWFENAIYGGNKAKSDGQNLIWGWVKISSLVAKAARKDKSFRDSFFDARFNIAQCRYQAAMKKKGDARRADLSNAKQGIQSLARVYPDYGGDTFKPQFEELLKDIQREEGKLAQKAGTQ
jgi:tetratricopeptide (TPR) repeat protein